MMDGIYTLANDVVYDQLVALLNSIEANAGKAYPVCIIAYDDNLEKVRTEVARRSNVTLLEDQSLFEFWEDYSYDVWKTHPTALETWKDRGITTRFYRVGENHRYCAFDEAAPFDRFIYLDADTLVLGPISPFFDALDHPGNDFVVYDFQFKDPSHIFNLNSDRLISLFPQGQVSRDIFCSGCYAARKGCFSREQLTWLVSQLKEGDSDILYLGAPNQSVLNYMVTKSGLKVHNLAFHLPPEKVSGNSVTSSHFQAVNHVLYDKEARLIYLHFIGISSKIFRRLCMGENLDFPYRDIFLHYRYLRDPQEQPQFVGKPVSYKPQPPSLSTRILKKLGLAR